MAQPLYFISYSSVDADEIALTLADQLSAGPPSFPIWIDCRNLHAGSDRYVQVVQALKDCQGVLYVMTKDSTDPSCPCTQEWVRALKYKKPVIPLTFHPDAELPFRLDPREPISFVDKFDSGLARLREHLRWCATPEGMLHTMRERLNDARRDLATAQQADKVRIGEEIADLRLQIEALQTTINNPQAAQERAQKSIQRGLERERQPEVPVASEVRTRFINRPPMVPPIYFQDRHAETGLIGTFLRNDNLRLMTVVGRGGVGKTAMVCRLLQSLEGGKLPDDGGELNLDGIVYLSARSGGPVNFSKLFYDLCKLLPDETAKYLDQIYKDPKQSCKKRMEALLAAFPRGRTIVLLDNFEDVVDLETQEIKEADLEEALRATLDAPPHGLKFILTTRVAPQRLLRVQPALQDSLELDQGLKSPYAENILRALDTSGTLGLNAPDAPLAEAREATRGFPRALEAVVGILRADRSTDLRGLLRELKELGSKAEDVVRDLVGEAFNRLDPLAQEVMQALAIYHAPVPAVAVDYLLQPYRLGIDSSKTLGRLVSMQFVRGVAGRFYLHQVDRDYALSRLVEGQPADREVEPPPLTCYALRNRAAEYFKETRKPREAWKTLNDLAPQLSEFDLRLVGGDYDAAANVLIEIDYDYLGQWGHYHLLLERYEPLEGKLTDRDLEWTIRMGLAECYKRTGAFEKAFRCYQDASTLAQAQNSKDQEAITLDGLSGYYSDIGDITKAMEHSQLALALYEDLGNKSGEANAHGLLANHLSDLGRFAEAIEQYNRAIALFKEVKDRKSECLNMYNLADMYLDLGENAEARRLGRDAQQIAVTMDYRLIECAAAGLLLGTLMIHEGKFADAIKAGDEACRRADDSNIVQMQMLLRKMLARAHLLSGDLPRARKAGEDAAKYRYPKEYAAVVALNGIVALRQADSAAAIKAFDLAINEAETQLAGLARSYEPAYCKALALAGLSLCRDAALATAAAQAYRAARGISAAGGVVADALEDLDALAVADPAGTLKPVRAALANE